MTFVHQILWMKDYLNSYLNKRSDAAPLSVFRIGFGLLMLFSIIRFWYNGWIESLYLEPAFHFTYYGFEWVKPLGNSTYLLFAVCGLSSLFVALGFKYRWAIVCFFLSFTYIELMDKTTYLNHYYFISILSFLMIFLPLNAHYSIDNLIRKRSYQTVPQWTIDSVKLLLSIVYLYAGMAKINSDWLLRAMPLKIWLTSQYDLPIIGQYLMQETWFHYAMSWGGMIYDLSIPFLLLYRKTRGLAFALVLFFHLFTRILFPIGMFPYIMIVATLIFFDAAFHHKVIQGIDRVLVRVKGKWKFLNQTLPQDNYSYRFKKLLLPILLSFFLIQLLLPFRRVFYPGELFWNEEGFRFSWRVMLMEKKGYTTFRIHNPETGESFKVENSQFLSRFQEKQMSFQPDFILEYAHFLGDHYKKELGVKELKVFAESYVALNGRLSRPFIDSSVDLYQEQRSFKHKDWIIPLDDEIKGL